jgi:hypothetical protein
LSDAELRTLERAVARSPDDLEARRSLALALARSGQSARSFAELARLARLGDSGARAEVGARIVRARSGLPARVRSGARRLTVTRQLTLRPQARLRAVADDYAIFTTGLEVVAVDLESMREAWRTPCAEGDVLLVGDVLCRDAGTWRTLNIATGEEVSRFTWPTSARELVECRAQLVAPIGSTSWSRPRGLVCAALTEDGVEWRWRHGNNMDFLFMAGAPAQVFLFREGVLEAIESESGLPLWSVRAAGVLPPRNSGSEQVALADETGVVLITMTPSSSTLGLLCAELEERDSATGARTWTADLELDLLGAEVSPLRISGRPSEHLRLARDRLVAPTLDSRGYVALAAVDRRNGERCWEVPVFKRRELAHDRNRRRWSFAVGEELAYFSLERARDQIEIVVVALESGERLFSKRVSLANGLAGALFEHGVIALPGSLLLSAHFEDGVVVMRLSD